MDKNIRRFTLNVALAASSCFPGGFEPIILRYKDYCTEANKFRNPGFYILKITYVLDKGSLIQGKSVLQEEVDKVTIELQKECQRELSLSLMDGVVLWTIKE